MTVKGSIHPITLYTYQRAETPDLAPEVFESFMVDWLTAFDAYVSGDWESSRLKTQARLRFVPDDGPA